jgi:Zn-dependent membrane protease YugP
MFYGFDPILLAITVVFMIIGMIVSSRLKSKFAKYQKTPLSIGMSGKEVAEKMLRDYQIQDVKVVSVQGQLTDHYNPATKTVNLSHDVYNGRNIAAAAVAAHECGHAVQHATAYSWLQMRSTLVPIVNIGSTLMNFILMGMAFLAYGAPHFGNTALIIVIICQGAITLFSLVTLPVEVDASQRALKWLDGAYIARNEQENREAKDALTWAGLTYFVAALASIATLLYFIMRFVGNNRD